jgi:CheY-like chemotaxis protein
MSTLKVLYVDDEPDIREIALFALGLDPELELRAADSGKSALKVLSDGDWRPDLILLDVMMPVIDGPTTLAEIRKLPGGGDVPVIFVTARAQSQELAALKEQGVLGVITKPFQPMQLAAEARRMLQSAT